MLLAGYHLLLTEAPPEPKGEPPAADPGAREIIPCVRSHHPSVAQPMKPDVVKRIQSKLLMVVQEDPSSASGQAHYDRLYALQWRVALRYVLGKIVEEGRDISDMQGFGKLVEIVMGMSDQDEMFRLYLPPKSQILRKKLTSGSPTHECQAVDPVSETVEPESQAGDPESQAADPECQAVDPESQAVDPESQAVDPDRCAALTNAVLQGKFLTVLDLVECYPALLDVWNNVVPLLLQQREAELLNLLQALRPQALRRKKTMETLNKAILARDRARVKILQAVWASLVE